MLMTFSDETAKALKPAMDGCVTQVKLLEKTLAISLPAKDDSSWTRRLKALPSLSKDKEAQQITVRLAGYVHASTDLLLNYDQS